MKAVAVFVLLLAWGVGAGEAMRDERRVAFLAAVATNGAAAAQAELGRVAWRGARDPQAELMRFAEAVGQRPGFDGVRREVATKLRLLMDGAAMDGTGGTLPVPVAGIAVLAAPVVKARRVDVVVLSATGPGTPAGVFAEALGGWRRRDMRRRVWRDGNGVVIVPERGTVLGLMRGELSDGEGRDDALIDAYEERMKKAVWRRRRLRD